VDEISLTRYENSILLTFGEESDEEPCTTQHTAKYVWSVRASVTATLLAFVNLILRSLVPPINFHQLKYETSLNVIIIIINLFWNALSMHFLRILA
jgi:hypothetical protein